MGRGVPPVQECIDWNRAVLKRELGLSEGDIVDIPQLFFLKGAYAEAFFPDMVRASGGHKDGWTLRLPGDGWLSSSYMGQVHALGCL